MYKSLRCEYLGNIRLSAGHHCIPDFQFLELLIVTIRRPPIALEPTGTERVEDPWTMGDDSQVTIAVLLPKASTRHVSAFLSS